MKSQIIQILMVTLFAGAALAQTSGAGTITGTVKDPSGATVPNAAVAIRNADTGVERSMQTNEVGIYVAPFLQPGHYEITVVKAGFAKIVRKDLTVQVGQTRTVNFELAVQMTSETLLVTGLAGVVDTEKTEVSEVVSTAAVQNLPLAGRR